MEITKICSAPLYTHLDLESLIFFGRTFMVNERRENIFYRFFLNFGFAMLVIEEDRDNPHIIA